MIIRLNKDQFDYLNYNLFIQQILKLDIDQIRKGDRFVILEIAAATADEIRDWASDQLQEKGFDANYELTQDGKILEELIDIFYV